MANPTFGTFSLQDDNYITTDVEYRTIPARDIVLQDIARKPGKKVISQEFAERHIRIAGWILGDSSSDLIDKIDSLHNNVTRKTAGNLTIDTDRNIETFVASVSITDPHYTQTAVPFQVEFVAAEPFFRGTQQTATITVPSGTGEPHTLTTTITISGSVFAEPSIVYNAPGGSGVTTTSGIIIEYGPTSETVTWSGGNASLAYGNFAKFDYANQVLLEGSSVVDPFGVFSRWEPGSTNFTVTFSGQAQGGTIDFIYRPRYL